ncbi:uncharacterized protein BYT42DRAFT_612657 [Radiomyces spectabilis]|uniref:uncharacterized protein n=1 Tax=Radiomyces spectabilis TaxID=64574 RepID=UPI002220CF03|nr:uncharacterized protein BYT42DRAFT_612657 [Radiomyces spectabilis]KAI8385000.1 hypothetical protein BYT42DRAFT_612657 [Radiomyces spectabilis]
MLFHPKISQIFHRKKSQNGSQQHNRCVDKDEQILNRAIAKLFPSHQQQNHTTAAATIRQPDYAANPSKAVKQRYSSQTLNHKRSQPQWLTLPHRRSNRHTSCQAAFATGSNKQELVTLDALSRTHSSHQFEEYMTHTPESSTKVEIPSNYAVTPSMMSVLTPKSSMHHLSWWDENESSISTTRTSIDSYPRSPARSWPTVDKASSCHSSLRKSTSSMVIHKPIRLAEQVKSVLGDAIYQADQEMEL